MDDTKEIETQVTPSLSNEEHSPAVPEVKPVTKGPVYSAQNLPDDKFSKGRVMKYFPQSKYGFIKDRKGKDVYFNIDEVRFVGEKGREKLKEGILVGYDVGWTAHGLHINRIKIY